MVTNQVGTTQRHTDSTGAVKNYYEYDAWGVPLMTVQGTSQQYRYTQKELDPDSIAFNSENRRYHFPARFYSPFKGLFAQVDSLLLMNVVALSRWHLSNYIYVLSNPLMYVDPLGLQEQGATGSRGPLEGFMDRNRLREFRREGPLPPDRPVAPNRVFDEFSYNCAGLAFRTYFPHPLADVKKRLAAACRELADAATKCKCGEIKCWLWEYTQEFWEGGKLVQQGTGFHIVCGLVAGSDPTQPGDDPMNCVSKDARTPVLKRKGTGESFKPEPQEMLAGGVTMVRKDMKTSVYCCDQQKLEAEPGK